MLVMSLSGGGVGGYFSTLFLSRLVPDGVTPNSVLCGTSVGALLASGLAMGAKPGLLQAVFLQHINKMFTPADRGASSVGFGAKYVTPRAALMDALDEVCSATGMPKADEIVMGDLSRRCFITATGLSRPVCRMLDSKKDTNVKLIDALLASTAAPTFFPTQKGRVDGALWANDPIADVLVVLANQGDLGQVKHAVSIGTGQSKLTMPSGNLGPAQWMLLDGPKLIELLLAAVTERARAATSAILPGKYTIVDVEHEYTMDDVGAIDKFSDSPDFLKWMNGEAVDQAAILAEAMNA